MTEVSLTAPSGSIVYEDSADHFENGLLRLMNLSGEEFERWLALSEAGSGSLLERLADGWGRLRPAPAGAGAAERTGGLRSDGDVRGRLALRDRGVARLGRRRQRRPTRTPG